MRTQAAGAEAPSGAAVVLAPVLVGRDEELVRLGDVLSTPPALVLVEGEAGIGKTRLLDEFLSSPAGGGLAALSATCPPPCKSRAR